MPLANTLVLIVEDEPAIAELVKYSLRGDGWVARSVPSVAEAWHFLQTSPPQLVLLDWMLGGECGLRLLSRIRRDRQLGDLPVIMLSGRTSDEHKVTGLDGGADDYVTKPFSPRELRARSQALLRRKGSGAWTGVLQVANVALDPMSCSVSVDRKRVEIGRSEYHLLHFLLSHPNEVFSRNQLLVRVWELPGPVDERTVDVHVLRLRKALRGAKDLIKTVRNAGYMLVAA